MVRNKYVCMMMLLCLAKSPECQSYRHFQFPAIFVQVVLLFQRRLAVFSSMWAYYSAPIILLLPWAVECWIVMVGWVRSFLSDWILNVDDLICGRFLYFMGTVGRLCNKPPGKRDPNGGVLMVCECLLAVSEGGSVSIIKC